MELSAGIQASLAGRYASALFDLASEAGTVTAVESDLDKLDAALRESAELSAVPIILVFRNSPRIFSVCWRKTAACRNCRA